MATRKDIDIGPERTRAEVLREDVRNAGTVFGAMHRGRMLPGVLADRVLRRCAIDDHNDLHEKWQDEATEAVLGDGTSKGNPVRAGYIEHMARRLLR